MTNIKFALVASLLTAAPGAAPAQEAPEICEPQTVAQWLGLETISGCTDEGTEDGDETAESEGPLQGLLQAHESSGGKSTAALEHANTMSGGAVLAAHSQAGAEAEDETEDDEEAEDEEEDGNGRPDNPGRPDGVGGGRP